MTETRRPHVKRNNALFKKFMSKYWYPYLTRRWDAEDVVLLNYGYEEDPQWDCRWPRRMSPSGTAFSSITVRRPRRISVARRYWRSAVVTGVEPRT